MKFKFKILQERDNNYKIKLHMNIYMENSSLELKFSNKSSFDVQTTKAARNYF